MTRGQPKTRFGSLSATHPADADGTELVVLGVDDVGAAEPLVPGLLPFGHQRAVRKFLQHHETHRVAVRFDIVWSACARLSVLYFRATASSTAPASCKHDILQLTDLASAG